MLFHLLPSVILTTFLKVQLLDNPELVHLREEFVAFLFQHASAKSASPIVIILLSSDAAAPQILASCEFYPEYTTTARYSVLASWAQCHLQGVGATILRDSFISKLLAISPKKTCPPSWVVCYRHQSS